MKKSAFLTAFGFYARVLACVLAAIGIASIIALQAGWLSFSKARDRTGPRDGFVLNAEEPSLVVKGHRIVMSQMIPVDSSLTYDLSAELRSIAPADMKNGVSQTYLGVVTFDKDGKETRGGPGMYRYAGALNFQLYSEGDWITLSGSITGEGDETHSQFRLGTKYVRLVALLNYLPGIHQPGDGKMTTEIRNVRFSPRVKMDLNY